MKNVPSILFSLIVKFPVVSGLNLPLSRHFLPLQNEWKAFPSG